MKTLEDIKELQKAIAKNLSTTKGKEYKQNLERYNRIKDLLKLNSDNIWDNDVEKLTTTFHEKTLEIDNNIQKLLDFSQQSMNLKVECYNSSNQTQEAIAKMIKEQQANIKQLEGMTIQAQSTLNFLLDMQKVLGNAKAQIIEQEDKIINIEGINNDIFINNLDANLMMNNIMNMGKKPQNGTENQELMSLRPMLRDAMISTHGKREAKKILAEKGYDMSTF